MSDFQEIIILKDPFTQHKLTILRDKNTGKEIFRKALHDIGIVLTYEMVKSLPLVKHPIETPLMMATGLSLDLDKLLFVSILRAGNGLLDGALSILPGTPSGFIGAERDHTTLQTRIYYEKLPPLKGKSIFVFDPMLATGHTLIAILDLLMTKNAENISIGSALAAPEGIQTVRKKYPNIKLYTGSIDERLNEKGYILPGLGDAGDRLYGTL